MHSHPLAVKAAENNPIDNKNYRCNPSLLIQYYDKFSQKNETKNVIIGKQLLVKFLKTVKFSSHRRRKDFPGNCNTLDSAIWNNFR